MQLFRSLFWIFTLSSAAFTGVARAADVVSPIDERFAGAEAIEEEPSFQEHVVPLLGRLGCNGRACHGSFQGRGDFRLSLFGYDFKADHEALTAGDEPRVDVQNPDDSLIIFKPTSEDEHEGGLRYEKGSWQHQVLRRWIEAGAKDDSGQHATLDRLEVAPPEIRFDQDGQQLPLRAVAHWSDGRAEDVTPLCRFQSNDAAVASVDETGIVESMGCGDTHVVVFYDKGVTSIPVLRAVSAELAAEYPEVPTPTKIDELVVAKLRKLGIVPSGLSSDEEFLRRVTLDVTGTLPTPAEVVEFLADPSPNKRAAKVDQLLERPAYAAWWATKFCDITGNNPQDGGNNSFRNEEGRQWYEWIYGRLAENVPYDEMIAGIVVATGRNEGESFEEYCQSMGAFYRKNNPADFAARENMPHYWSKRSARKPEEKALGFAHAFLGLRLECAQCHKHPFDQWSKHDFEQFTEFFTAVQYGTPREDAKAYKEMTASLGVDKKAGNAKKQLPQLLDKGKTIPFQEVYVSFRGGGGGRKNKNKGQSREEPAKTVTATLLGGQAFDFAEGDDPRAALMEWMRREDNPYFAAALVNRVWANYFNVGIINPPDDLNLANPPSNKPLLDWLTAEFIAHDYDLRWLHRTITASRTYQASWQTNETNRLDTRNFSHAVPRRLPAEVIYDALGQATSSDKELATDVTGINGRAIGSTGNYQRNNARGEAYALLTFGKPLRETNCDCERSDEPSLLQTLYLRNDVDVLSMIDRRGGWLEQVAREHLLGDGGREPQPRVSATDSKKLDVQRVRFEKQLEGMKRQLEQARKSGNEKRIKKVEGRKDDLEKQIAALDEELDLSEPQSAPAGADANATEATNAFPAADQQPELIRQIYLRTVSRLPSDDEMARAMRHLQESTDPAAGLRDILWAMLNTKEFIVNH